MFSLHDAEIFIDGGFDDDFYRGGLPPLGYYGGEFYGQNESAEDDMFFNENEALEENFYKDT